MNNINFGQNVYDLSISESQYFDVTLVLSVFNKKHKFKLNEFDCLGELINHLKQEFELTERKLFETISFFKNKNVINIGFEKKIGLNDLKLFNFSYPNDNESLENYVGSLEKTLKVVEENYSNIIFDFQSIKEYFNIRRTFYLIKDKLSKKDVELFDYDFEKTLSLAKILQDKPVAFEDKSYFSSYYNGICSLTDFYGDESNNINSIGESSLYSYIQQNIDIEESDIEEIFYSHLLSLKTIEAHNLVFFIKPYSEMF